MGQGGDIQAVSAAGCCRPFAGRIPGRERSEFRWGRQGSYEEWGKKEEIIGLDLIPSF